MIANLFQGFFLAVREITDETAHGSLLRSLFAPLQTQAARNNGTGYSGHRVAVGFLFCPNMLPRDIANRKKCLRHGVKFAFSRILQYLSRMISLISGGRGYVK